jgi:uncharacterized protein (TIGR02996 family)
MWEGRFGKAAYARDKEGRGMNDVSPLLTGVLDQTTDLMVLLVLADWLEEHGDPDSLARAELLRLRAQWVGAASNSSPQRKADKRATAILTERPALIGPLQPLLPHKFRVLAAPSLALFLVADHASVSDDSWTPGVTWGGKLKQHPYSFPTTLQIIKRDGNRMEGEMKQNFRAMYRSAVSGTFHFRGVAVGAHVAFVTWRMEGAASGPGLYQFRAGEQNRWTGTWAVGAGNWNGTIWLEPKSPRRRKQVQNKVTR